MTVRQRASVIPGLALGAAALALAGCASQGTIGTGAAGAAVGPLPGPASSTAAGTSSAATGTDAPTSTSTDSPAPGTPTSSAAASSNSPDPSAMASSLKALNDLWTDPGCKTALAGFSIYINALEQGPAQGIAAIPAAVPKIRAGAQQTKKPGAAVQMNKMAADLLTMYTQAQQGKTPDKGPVKTDFQIMGNICSQQQP